MQIASPDLVTLAQELRDKLRAAFGNLLSCFAPSPAVSAVPASIRRILA